MFNSFNPLVTTTSYIVSILEILFVHKLHAFLLSYFQHFDSWGLFLFPVCLLFLPDKKDSSFQYYYYIMLKTAYKQAKLAQKSLYTFSEVIRHMGSSLDKAGSSLWNQKVSICILSPQKISICHGSFLKFMILVCSGLVLKHR